MASQTFRIAAVQAAPVSFSLAASIDKLSALTAQAASPPHSASLVVFPEGFLSAYPRGSDFGAVVGSRTDEGREWFRRYHESALDVEGDDESMERLRAAARDNGVTLVVGVIEKDGSASSTLYCTALIIGPDGRLLAKHRKLMPTGSERLVWGQGDGSGLQVVETSLGKIGAVICWENYMPLLRYAMYAQGIEIYCAPTADHRDVWASSMRHIAAEGRCFVVSVNQYATKADFPEDYPAFLGKPNGHVATPGGSLIVGPFGQVLAGPLWNEEGILVAEVDRKELARAHYDFDPTGHYSRPDVFHLSVDNTPRPVATFSTTSSSSSKN